MPYRLAFLAEQDLVEVWACTADRLIDAIVDRFDLLVEQPAIGRSRPKLGAVVRSFVVEG